MHPLFHIKFLAFLTFLKTRALAVGPKSARSLRAQTNLVKLKCHSKSRTGSTETPGEAQRWFERLPMHLREEPKRRKLVMALRQALQFVEVSKP
jgi:hypothetical protein